ncbi:hypothetical protein JCM10295v2_001801 [Rhodotorula toruloides]
MSAQPTFEESAYPPVMQNGLQVALNNREAMDSDVLDESTPHPSQVHDEEERRDAMRIRGGCFEIPCPGIPCTIA